MTGMNLIKSIYSRLSRNIQVPLYMVYKSDSFAWFRKLLLRKPIKEADVILLSYAKSGRTWLRLMIGMIFKYEFQLDCESEALRLGKELSELHAGIPNIYVNHFILPSFIRNQNKKVILLVRNPKDVMVSYYFHATLRNKKFSGTLQEFVRSRRFGIRPYLRYYGRWVDQLKEASVHVVRYEDLKTNAEQEMARLYTFITGSEASHSAVARAVEFCTFENMRKYEAENKFAGSSMQAKNPTDVNAFKTRKGQVGGYTEHLTPEDIAYIDAQAESVMKAYRY